MHAASVCRTCAAASRSCRSLASFLLPHIQQFNKPQKSTREALSALGKPPIDTSDKSKTLLSILTKFSLSYQASINGSLLHSWLDFSVKMLAGTNQQHHASNELSGGAMVCQIFDEKFGRILEVSTTSLSYYHISNVK